MKNSNVIALFTGINGVGKDYVLGKYIEDTKGSPFEMNKIYEKIINQRLL